MVEQLTLNQLVRGSSPRGATSFQYTDRQRLGVFSPVISQSILGQQRKSSRRRSSTVEHLFCKQAVAGSNPIAGSSSVRRRDEAEINFSLPDGVMVAQTTLTRFV